MKQARAIRASNVSGEVYNNRFSGENFRSNSGCAQLYIHSRSSLRIFNNIFDNITSSLPLVYYSCIGIAVDGSISDGQLIEITNNTFFANESAIVVQKFDDALTNINIMNNILQNNDYAITAAENFDLTFEPTVFNNIIYSNGIDFNNVSASQLFQQYK